MRDEPRAYYNENDARAAAWLEELIRAGHIAPGDVDRRSIRDVNASDLDGYAQCHFFAGIGVWSYALRNAGWLDDRPVWTGSCPCQPWSEAGAVWYANKGESDPRDLWPCWRQLIRALRPEVIFGERVSGRSALRWIDRLLDNLGDDGYAVRAIIAEAAAFGSCQRRERFYFAANTDSERVERYVTPRRVGSPGSRRWRGEEDLRAICEDPFSARNGLPQSLVRSNDDGVAGRVGLLRGYGNAIVAPAAQAFIEAVMDT